KFDEMVGHADRLDVRKAVNHWKAEGLDFGGVFTVPEAADNVEIYNCQVQEHGLEKAIDRQLIERGAPALESGEPVRLDDIAVSNVNRAVGAMLSGEVARRYGHAGLPDDTIHITARGNGGQSFGAFLAAGITLELAGEANDYTGKGLSGGRIIVYPSPKSRIRADENIIVGNTVLYGAVSGEAYFSGVAGERFCVRNSGATAIVEGVGDHGCEYMTGGCVVVLGATGRNFAAGMSGGVAYVLDEDGRFEQRCNLSMVELEPISDEDEALERDSHQGGDLEAHGLVDLMHDMTRYDEQRLKTLIDRYCRYTGSEKAKAILAEWEIWRSKFVKVMPVEYRKALERMQNRHEDHEDVNIAVGA
ncbi:MAG: glutamate synthase subunit alpha, partial [Proteobacteria bacterium]